jgi:hypothetical protein
MRRATRRSALALLLAPLLLSTGCVSLVFDMVTDPMGRKSALRLAQREYTKAVRWGEIEVAANFVDPDIRAEYLGYEAEFAGIRVTDFDVGELTYGPDLKTAQVHVTYHAYSVRAMTEVQIKETQQWLRPGGGNQWVVRPELEGIIDRVVDFRL